MFMQSQRLAFQQNFPQSPAAVYAALSDHNRLGAVLGAPVKRIRDGKTDPNGVGSVRRVGPWPLGVQETVTVAEPERRIEYRITRFGGPIRNHRGVVKFAPDGDGTRVDWTINFDSLPVLGGGVAALLRRVIAQGLHKLARKL